MPRRITRNLDADQAKAGARQAHRDLGLRDIYPLNAPGMPPPGPDFIEQARRLGEETELSKKKVKNDDGTTMTVNHLAAGECLADLHRKALRTPGFSLPIDLKPGMRKPVTFVPGHIWGEHLQEYVNGEDIPVNGPQPATVMVVGKMPGEKDAQHLRCFLGKSAEMFVERLDALHVTDPLSWYVTHLLKFRPPDGSTTIKAPWMKDCLHLLHQELRMVRPKYILCLGADPSKALLGKRYNVNYMDGRVIPLKFPVNVDAEDDPVGLAREARGGSDPARHGRQVLLLRQGRRAGDRAGHGNAQRLGSELSSGRALLRG
jgi:uracil-DNA glycosylase family 4